MIISTVDNLVRLLKLSDLKTLVKMWEEKMYDKAYMNSSQYHEELTNLREALKVKTQSETHSFPVI